MLQHYCIAEKALILIHKHLELRIFSEFDIVFQALIAIYGLR